MVKDKESKKTYDLLTAPLSRATIQLSYVINSFVIGLFFSLLALVGCERICTDIIKENITKHPYFELLSLMDKDGLRKAITLDYTEEEVYVNFSHRPYFKEAIQEEIICRRKTKIIKL